MRFARWIPLLLLLLLGSWWLSLWAARATSMTIDEGLHITSGYTMLRTGDYRLVEEHPPLVKMWIALPLLGVPDLPDPTSFAPWAEAATPTTESLPLLRLTQQWFYPYQPVDRLVIPARAMSALLNILLGAIIFRWGMDLWGWSGGMLSLFLWAADPNLLAHASVAGTDLGATAMIALALFTFHRFLASPAFSRLILAGVTLGLAQGAKTSALILLPVVLLIGMIALPARRRGILLVLLLLAGLTLWALYRFQIGPALSLPFPVPAPAHTIPWMRLRQHMMDGHAAFLLGENRTHGWWYYFPVAFALKTPLPTLLLLLALIAIVLHRGIRRVLRYRRGLLTRFPEISWKPTLARWGLPVLFPLLYGVISLFSPLNIGYRHLLPVLPFLFILAGRLSTSPVPQAKARATFSQAKARATSSQAETRATSPLLPTPYSLLRIASLAWLALGTLRVAPHYLAYFNELAGGPDNGWRYLADSNTDWGQGYKDLARFQKERHLGPVRLSAFIFYDPAIYGVRYEPLTPMRGDTPAIFPSRLNPPPGDYVISATTLDGIPLVDPEMYDWFRKREPDARIAHVLFYYHIPPQDLPPTWVAQCTVPDAPLSPEAVAEGFGRDDLRRVYFDCTEGWLYPAGGDVPGWYVFYRDPVTETPFARSHLSPARLSYEQKRRSGTPPFRVYEWPAGARVPGLSVHLVLPEGMSSPVPLDGPLTFLGATASRQADALEVETWWQVTAGPITRPLSIMAHLLTDAGDVLGLADGLGVSPVMWQPGDVIVQRHRFPLPQASVGLYLRTGAYWLDTMERWPLARAPEVNIMLLPIHPK
jgi:hypothetical protein